MSITTRMYTQSELESIKSGKNRFLATVFMNGKTFSENSIKFYPYELRKDYEVWFKNQDEPVTVYATSDFQLRQFLAREYDYNAIEEITEETRKYRSVELSPT